MSIIIKCQACKTRLKEGETCPCGSPGLLFFLDYWPDGRHGKRERLKLDVGDAKEAKELDAEYRDAALKARKPRAEILASATFEELTPDYLEWVRLNRRPGTYREREYTMEYINRIVGNIPILAFNDHHVSLFQKKRKATGASNKTVNKELYYVMAFLKWARNEKNVAVRDVAMKKLPYSRPLPIVLSPGEVARFLEASTPFYRAFVLCLYTIGLRFSEAQQLRWRDIDFENMAIRCEQKGGSFKILPMGGRLKTALLEIAPWKDHDERMEHQGAHIFISRITNRPIVNVRKGIEAIATKAKITKHVFPHLFRHSVATAMLSDKTNLRTVQGMLGHADIGTTEFYTHVDISHLREAENAIEKALLSTENSS